ncbi:tripartite tricarboxylate transporter substrate binding protein [Alcaligenaceae bacterium LF4-65]|jgi:tripartite-type tricarboxylate transporter receptor subunit TctC|uniref:Tripartite tricarboxylate transporter substrate binding protein n=1 Tax=Zwartia hollandica TaxID=324606 RepID=A0A953T5J5_9BURK|nr:tripartite tricarboxylate transporter substrate binding protein [Zwartia hollandica]MBZ1350962.1 tripartite tricarboxylate transporter substrate binding protein [Zwartia hollandica]
MKKIKFLFALAASSFALSSFAQTDWPNKPIQIIVTFAPGGTSDVLARAIAPDLSKALGQPVLVVNKPGANSTIATREVARAAPDGNTIGLFISAHAINPHITKSLPYDTKKDFTPLAMLALMPGILTVNPSVPAKNLQELVALAKAKPGSLAYGTPGGLTSGQLSMQYLIKLAAVDITEIGYKGGGPALTDLLAGHIQMLINSPTSTIPHVKSGKLRPIATTGATRPEALKDIPTIAESGFPGFELYEWYALFLPAGTPKPIVDRLYAEVMKVMASPAMVKRIAEIGAQSSTDTPQQFAKFLEKEDKVWGDLVKQIGIKPE